jgi:hypothetical protein
LNFRNDQPPRQPANSSSCTFAPTGVPGFEPDGPGSNHDLRFGCSGSELCDGQSKMHLDAAASCSGLQSRPSQGKFSIPGNIDCCVATIGPSGYYRSCQCGGSSFLNGPTAGRSLEEGLRSCKGEVVVRCILRTGQEKMLLDAGY